MKIVREDIEVRILHEPVTETELKKSEGLKSIIIFFKKMNLRNKTKKVIISVFTGYFLLVQNPVAVALAIEMPSAPEAPSAPAETSTPNLPTSPSTPDSPTSPEVPSTPSAPSTPEGFNSTQESNQQNTEDEDRDWDRDDHDNNDNSDTSSGNSDTPEVAPTQTETLPTIQTEDSGGSAGDNNVGDTTVDTGDATANAGIMTNANTNISALLPEVTEGSGGITVVSDGNGSDSSNSGSASVSNDTVTNQANSATVGNILYQETETGDNSASRNVGDSKITTGDANTTGTVITAVNTNIDGVMVSEFNVADDHVGDIVLDFNAGCIAGCFPGDLSAENSGNGTGSENSSDIDSTVADYTFQNNDASVVNDVTLKSDSGSNTADRNTGGNSLVETGDANVAANVLTLANNNLSGNVIYSVVNLFGDVIGDIIFPEGYCCFTDASAVNTDNGSETNNIAEIDISSTDQTFQFNDADIKNNLVFDANTGDNDVSKNTGGTNTVNTGDASVEAQVVNIANTNISGGDWWLVIVNEAGNWVGKILGAPVGSLFAGSEGFGFAVGESGDITVSNSGNGSESTNTAAVSQENTDVTVQGNSAEIVNNINLSANTGKNSASRNTGGDSTIETGDADIVANLVNFVNNNISGGRLFVTVVNVFGSWFGNFVGPGQEKEEANTTQNQLQEGLGGASTNTENQNDNNSQNSANNATSNSQKPTTTSTVNIGVSKSASDKKVLALASTSDSSNPLTGQNQESLGDSTFIPVAGKKTVKINLAWLTLIIPTGLVYVVIKRKVNRLSVRAQI